MKISPFRPAKVKNWHDCPFIFILPFVNKMAIDRDLIRHNILAISELECNDTDILTLGLIEQCINSNTHQNSLLFLSTKLSEGHFRPTLYSEQWIHLYNDDDFHSHFRMTRDTFNCLLGLLESDIDLIKFYYGGNEPLEVSKKVLITLWYLAKEGSMMSIADRFNVAKSTVKNTIICVVQAINRLAARFIVWPSSEDCIYIEEKFRLKAGFPGVIGAIDESRIPVKTLKTQQESYTDRHFEESIILQAVCTSEKVFTNVCVGYPRRGHNARVLSDSNLYNNICSAGPKTLFYDKFHLVGDSAYPCRNWLVTPYRDSGNLTVRKRRFNTKLRQTRVCIENCFGLLKGRWRRLSYVNVSDITKATEIIMACCVLHNFCYINCDIIDTMPLVNPLNQARVLNDGHDDTVMSGAIKRNMILNLI